MSDWVDIPQYPTCFVCGDENPIGLRVRFRARDKYVEADFVPQPHHCGYEGIVHGGIVTALMDEGMGWTGWLSFGRYFLTVELNIRFKRPVRAKTKYKFTAELVRKIGQIYVARGKLIAPNGDVVAEGEGKYYITDVV